MRKPVIGITQESNGRLGSTTNVYPPYADSVEKAGGLPLGLAAREDLSQIPSLLDQLDGLLLAGGDDLDPALYQEMWHPQAVPLDPVRQRFEMALITAAEQRRLPILGICLGSQVMNVHRGGNLTQFLPDLPRPCPLEHRKVNGVVPRHGVKLAADSVLARALGTCELSVNSYHKQAVRRPGRGLRAVGYSPDGIIEAIEDPAARSLFLGVQWHPERLSDEAKHLAVIQLLVRRSGKAAV